MSVISPFLPPTITSPITMQNGLLPLSKSMVVSSVINIQTINGNNDLFTVPLGKRAALSACLYNQSGGSLTYTPQLKINGVYVLTGPVVPVSNNASVSILPFNSTLIAEAGETISLNCSGIMGLFAGIVLFDVTDGILSPKLTTLQTGDNTLYTCPAGKYAFTTNASNAGNSPIRVLNNSGATRTYKLRCVPFGVSPSDTFLIAASFTAANGTQSNQAISSSVFMKPGDFININVDAGTATQFAQVLNVVEQFI
jgi:hypothetical protein